MWHAVVFLLLVGLASPVKAQIYDYSSFRNWNAPAQSETVELEADPAALERIVNELRDLRNIDTYQSAQPFSVNGFKSHSWSNEAEQEVPNSAKMANFGRDLQQLMHDEQLQQQQVQIDTENNVPNEISMAEKSQPELEQEINNNDAVKQPLKAQKKGQNEYVEFVEPHAVKALKNVEILDKRASVKTVHNMGTARQLLYGSNNVLFIVAVTVCSVATVVGVVGGAYYLNAVRKQRAEAFDDFTRYSPAGPGRDMLRKGRGFAGSPITEHGDDALAKAAHLHHYEQTKQKIIGSDTGVNDDHSDKSDDEADDLEEHNFSIYECPGLAPTTGDIEVQNPNFPKQHP